ncbi:histone-lysine N-methyltransferase SETMAR [Trichonephila clavipes]|nr:histone-lysine N-methyltransferase SETMAR [Trichonephila clavipes]
MLFHDNTCPPTAVAIQELPNQFKRKIFDNPPCSPDPAPSHHYLFLKLKKFLGSKYFESDEELENALTT